MTFTLDYRPHTFTEVVGQSHIKPILRAMVLQQNPPPALIFGGSRGTGKTTSARILAAALNCEQSQDLKGDACGVCASCKSVQASNSIVVLEVDAASNTGVEDIRKIRDLCAYAADGKWRVVLLDEAHSLSKQAFNALLKTLEEPPAQTVFVLLTTEVDKVIETVRSRSMYFEFRRLTIADIIGRLRTIVDQESLDVQDDLLADIAMRVQGGMRDAVMLLDQVSRVGIKDLAGFHELFGIKNVALPLFTAALEGNHTAGTEIIEDYFYRVGDASGMVADLVTLVKDLLVMKSGGLIPTPEGEALAQRVDTGHLVGVIKVLWDLKVRTRNADNDQRASMEMAFALISDVLAPSTVTRVPTTPITTSGDTEPKSLTLAELRAQAIKG